MTYLTKDQFKVLNKTDGTDLKMKHLQQILQPMMTEWTARNTVKSALTIMGRQATSIDELDTNRDFVFGNCVVQSGGTYDDTVGLRHSNYRMVVKIFNEISKKCFGRAAFPKLRLIRDMHKRREFAVHWYNASQRFHINNICPALWAQAMMWASLSFLEWIAMDRCFPITYILSTQHGIGKTTTMHALAASIGLPAEVITGNKSSESGMLDWLNSVCCIGYILDDFNAKSVNSSKEQNTWKVMNFWQCIK